ncbi:MAG: 50S ribosomal protein L9 [Acidobacteria bacterium]|nr:MAG: 50S ribosomal protein L9 [Acidobacteriota bacterium]TDI47351.1 MAG: 50S ribosomal protein L9 [Acidobacteriota bacterium]
MKVVLREDLEHVGLTGEVVEVAAGYARNYLVPKGIAVAATAANLKMVAHQESRNEARNSKERAEMELLAQQITSTHLELSHRAGDSDTIYGAVTAAEIAFALEEAGIQVDHRRIQLEKPIKMLGAYTIPVRLHAEVTAHVTVNVVRDDI